MKILYYTFQKPSQQLRMDEQADYQSDLLFHGLRTLYGEKVVDYPKKSYLYNSFGETKGLWGRGFGFSKNLPDIEIDREDLVTKIINKHYDLIVFSIHHSMQFDYKACYQSLEAVREIYSGNICVIDGHDWVSYNPDYFNLTNYFFKREIDNNSDSRLIPIWFGIPEEKIVKTVPEKIKDFSFIQPGSQESHWPSDSRKTHIYENEQDYYKDYQEAYFGLNSKKGGWQTFRIFEILSQGCVPVYTDIENCPSRIHVELPKETLIKVKKMSGLYLSRDSESLCYTGDKIREGSKIDHPNFNYVEYEYIANELLIYTKKYLTTEALAKHVLETVND